MRGEKRGYEGRKETKPPERFPTGKKGAKKGDPASWGGVTGSAIEMGDLLAD